MVLVKIKWGSTVLNRLGQYMNVPVLSCSVVSDFVTPWTLDCQVSLSMGVFRQEYWSGHHFLLQGIFPTQESNPGLLHCRQILYCLSHQGSPSTFNFPFFKHFVCIYIWEKSWGVYMWHCVARELPFSRAADRSHSKNKILLYIIPIAYTYQV